MKIKKILLAVLMLFTCVIFLTKTTFATSSTASVKGFTTTNLDYLGDFGGTTFEISTSKYVYGYCSMWTGVYQLILEEENNTTCYIVTFIESSINSKGYYVSKRYFRNKRLIIDINFECSDKDGGIVVTYPDSSSSTTSTSIGFNANGEVTSNNGIGINGGFTYTSTTQYSTVTLTKNVINSEVEHNVEFIYNFNNYKNGKMVAPNVGEVKERMFVVYQIPHYDGNETYNIEFLTHASIFKDATWPLSNATMAGQIIDKFNGKYYSHSKKIIDES